MPANYFYLLSFSIHHNITKHGTFSDLLDTTKIKYLQLKGIDPVSVFSLSFTAHTPGKYLIG